MSCIDSITSMIVKVLNTKHQLLNLLAIIENKLKYEEKLNEADRITLQTEAEEIEETLFEMQEWAASFAQDFQFRFPPMLYSADLSRLDTNRHITDVVPLPT